MKKQTLKLEEVKRKLNKTQLIASLVQKNLKGGQKCPPPFD